MVSRPERRVLEGALKGTPLFRVVSWALYYGPLPSVKESDVGALGCRGCIRYS